MKFWKSQTFLLSLGIAIISAVAGFAMHMLVADKPVSRQMEGMEISQADLVGQSAPLFELAQREGGTATLDRWSGKVRVVNFWASWCTPCREEMPDLMRFHRDHVDQGVTVVGIAIDSKEASEAFLAEVGVDYPILIEDGPSFRLMEAYGNPRGLMPQTVIVDQQGIIREIFLGKVHYDQLVSAINAL